MLNNIHKTYTRSTYVHTSITQHESTIQHAYNVIHTISDSHSILPQIWGPREPSLILALPSGSA